MTKFSFYLFGGFCLGGLISLQVYSASEGHKFAEALKARIEMREHASLASPISYVAEAEGSAAATDATSSAPAEPVPGVTSYYGETASVEEQPFAAPATVFEDVTVTEAPSEISPAAEPAAVAEETPAQPAPVAETESAPAAVAEAAPGVTSYYGDAMPVEGQPFSAPATVYESVSESAAAPAAEPAAPTEEAAASAPAEAVPGVTSYYGDTPRAEDQPFSAPAKMVAATEAAPAAPAAETCVQRLNNLAFAGHIRFANASYTIGSQSTRTLDKLAAAAKECAGVVIEVGGYTDDVGSAEANKVLSLKRAQSVLKYLTKKGIDEARLKAVGYGQDQPVMPNATEEGRERNRRIEFRLVGP